MNTQRVISNTVAIFQRAEMCYSLITITNCLSHTPEQETRPCSPSSSSSSSSPHFLVNLKLLYVIQFVDLYPSALMFPVRLESQQQSTFTECVGCFKMLSRHKDI